MNKVVNVNEAYTKLTQHFNRTMDMRRRAWAIVVNNGVRLVDEERAFVQSDSDVTRSYKVLGRSWLHCRCDAFKYNALGCCKHTMAVYMQRLITPMELKPYTVLLRYPDYLADDASGSFETYLSWVMACTPQQATEKAQVAALESYLEGDEALHESAEDFEVLSVFEGHLRDFSREVAV